MAGYSTGLGELYGPNGSFRSGGSLLKMDDHQEIHRKITTASRALGIDSELLCA
jgi:hypothetical protein